MKTSKVIEILRRDRDYLRLASNSINVAVARRRPNRLRTDAWFKVKSFSWDETIFFLWFFSLKILFFQLLKASRDDEQWKEHFRLTSEQFYGKSLWSLVCKRYYLVI